MNIQLLETDKQVIMKNIIDRFHVDSINAQSIVDNMEKALLGKNEDFFYHLKYHIHFQNSSSYSMKVLNCAIEIFSYLQTREAYASELKELKAFFSLFFKTVFTQQCYYAKKIEKRGDSVQKALRHMSNQLNKILDTNQLLIANISHDMRTSLNAVTGYLSLIEEKNILEGEEKNFLTKAKNASFNLKELVSDILDITKINSGQMEITEEFFWLDEIILKCIDSIAIELSRKEITFKTDIDFFPKKIFGDRHHIIRIIINLLSNAVKYTDNGFIYLRVKKEQRSDNTFEILFQVEDSGIGMTQEQLDHIFDPYSRFIMEEQGIGLGLHIASKLAQKLGGSLSAKSTYGTGSSFDFSIKLQEESENLIKTVNTSICFFTHLQETDNFKQKKTFLETHGIEILTFNHEQRFINYLLTQKDKAPDIISIVANTEGYSKFDALINYLKTLPAFKTTSFIAEGTEKNLSLSFFDQRYEYFTPVSTYLSMLKISPVQKGEMLEASNEEDIHILLVDDIETNLEILELFILKKYPNINIDLAAGGYEAIGMYKTQTYDMILLDLKMPGLNGFEILERLKGIHSLPPTYALTADVYKKTYHKVMETGFTGLLEKPLQFDALFEIIEKVIHAKNN